MIGAVVITASDRSARGVRADASGPALAALLARVPAAVAAVEVVPDTVRAVRGAIRRAATAPGVRLVLTTGGTGVTPRDVTPEATAALIDRDLPGLALAMRRGSWAITPFAVISRALAGFCGDCLVVNMPGSPRAVEECFGIVLPTLRRLFGPGAQRESGREGAARHQPRTRRGR